MKANRFLTLRGVSLQRAAVLVLALLVFTVGELFGQSQSQSQFNDADGLGKLGAGLRELVEWNRQLIAKGQPGIDWKSAAQPDGRRITGIFRLESDTENRVLADIHLGGGVPLASIQNSLNEMGAAIVATDSSYRNGVISAYLPVAAAEKLAHTPGVISVQLAHRAVMFRQRDNL